MLNRRVFLARGAGALVTLGLTPSRLARAGLAQAADAATPRGRIVVVVFMRGGVDGLSLVAPFGDPEYYRLRPSLALAPPGVANAALDLDGFFGFHPRMTPLLPWWRRGQLAVVHACGLPVTMPSHFTAQDAMDAALAELQAPPGLSLPTWHAGLGRPADRLWHHDDLDSRESPAAHGVEYPPSSFGRALRRIAVLAKARAGSVLAGVECGGWDHHVDQGAETGLLADRIDDLSRGLAAFVSDMDEHLGDLLVCSVTEFGRTLAENGRQGTDHGHGSAMLLLGGRVRGRRVYGPWPGLARQVVPADSGLAVTTDVRDVLAEIARFYLGSDPWRPGEGHGGTSQRGRSCRASYLRRG